ncbi:uncharacterized protein IWZ02DRAFT_421895 [Phyllosticta citriasiana]|uniref:uncharacterized protein n=1 Tax=Phyllosticta citriasiana TaxID=595635 RepID=UPI0030FDB959
MAAPTVPPRPARSTPQQQQQQQQQNGSTAMPSIPPRPKRSTERSISPNRDNFARSPLNDPSFINGSSTNHSKRLSASDLPARPPSVTLPTIGQEGSEYASFDTPPIDENAPQQTRDAEGLKLYAPTASLPQSTNRSRIAGVTRADSAHVAAAGLGKKPSETDLFPGGHSRGHSRSGSSTGRSSRPTSLYQQDEEHGIPEIGLQVPMYPNAGDVQAPTPSLHSNAPSTGVGYFNNGGSSAKLHGRPFAGPPGSYGMHGHGLKPTDELERKWYASHPDDAAREAQGAYGPAIQENRREWTLSSEQLNKLVQESANKGVGMGASPAVTATPGEEIGYKASEEYASRMASPRPQSVPPKERTRSSQSHAESPLRMTSAAADQALGGGGGGDGSAIEHDDEGNVIHIDPPAHPRSEMHGPGIDYDDLGPEGGNGEEHVGFITEDGRGTPVLASDELKRHQTPGGEYQQPAVPAELEHERRISQEGGEYHRRSGSRSTSRPTSVSRWRSQGDVGDDRSNTPLDGVKEYEPLFPEDEDEMPVEKPLTAADKLKRPELARHHFPSQDVWEDTPSSLQLQAEVQTPEVPSQPASGNASLESSQVFEKPEKEHQRKADPTPKDQQRQQSFLPDHAKRLAHLNKDVLADMPSRPGMHQRFPSRDIWEDTPDELKLVTTVNAPQDQDSPSEPKSAISDVPAKPQIPARLTRAKPGESPIEKKAAPIIPDRPKPQIPARPARPAHKPSDEAVPLSKVSSASSNNTATADDGAVTAAPPVTKPKPPVPSRPGGSKIAALKAGFLSNLESRLQLGPQGPKKEPKEEKEDELKEKAPLADARKGRAKGPARRRPGTTSAAAPADASQKPAALAFSKAVTVFVIDEDGALEVPQSSPEEQKKDDAAAAHEEIATQVPRDPLPAPADAEKDAKPIVDVKTNDTESPSSQTAVLELKDAADKPATTTTAAASSTSAAEKTQQPEEEAAEVEAETVTAVEHEQPLLAKQQTNNTTSSTDSTTQTGQQDIVASNPATGAAAAAEADGDKATQTSTSTEKITAYLGGRAQEEGSVVVREVVAGEGKGDADAEGEGRKGEGEGDAVLEREEYVGGEGEGGVVGEARVQRTGHGM